MLRANERSTWSTWRRSSSSEGPAPGPGATAELIATNIPNAASMCYDAGANQLVIPMNANNALAFVPLQ